MICPEPHFEEELRLQSLEKFAILDSPLEQEYDDLTYLASKISKSPIALICLIDKNRQWFKSHHGLKIRETAREYAFCAHAINSNDDIFIVQDARIDPRFTNNPFVTGNPNVVFYAGIPLVDDNYLPLGTLCVIDNKPKDLSTNEINLLKILANQVMSLLNHRKRNEELNQLVINLRKKVDGLEEFALDLTHNLKSPLINISAISIYLSNNYGNKFDDDGKTLISLIQNSSKQLKNLIDDTLNYYIDGNKIQEKMSSIELKNFFHQIFELFSYENAIKFVLNTSLKRITFNSGVLHQIITNLISNAIRYNDKRNVLIEIDVLENPHALEFHIKDNGPGIPEHLHKKVFELFMIGQKYDKNKEKGKGIGLATVKKLVEGMGGAISLENGKENGCRFSIRVPNILKPLILN